MPFRAVFFDMDGVLVDSFDAAAATMNDAARHRGLPPVDTDRLKAVFGQSSARDVEMFFPGWPVAEFESFYVGQLPRHLDLIKPLPGATSVMDDLDARGVATAVITNTPAGLARSLLEGLNIIPHALVGAGDVERPKPAPDMIFRACEVLDVEPWDVLVVGDSEYDKQAAAAAGAPFAGINGVAGNFTLSALSDVLTILDGTFQ